MTTFYVKKGRKYVPTLEYDNEFNDAWPEGTHLTISKPGSRSRRYNIEPALAPMIAAGHTAEDRITKIILDKLTYKPDIPPYTDEQKAAWEHMREAYGEELCRLNCASIIEAVRAGVQEMINEAAELLENPALQQSYDNFLLLSKLTKGK